MTAHPPSEENGTDRWIMTCIRGAGFYHADAVDGLAWAHEQGFTTPSHGYNLVMSRILFTDDELASGKRFCSVDAGDYSLKSVSIQKRDV